MFYAELPSVFIQDSRWMGKPNLDLSRMQQTWRRQSHDRVWGRRLRRLVSLVKSSLFYLNQLVFSVLLQFYFFILLVTFFIYFWQFTRKRNFRRKLLFHCFMLWDSVSKCVKLQKKAVKHQWRHKTATTNSLFVLYGSKHIKVSRTFPGCSYS